MTEKEKIQLSKLLSLVLRHQPETIGIALDPEGWVKVDDLLAALRAHKNSVTKQDIDEIIETNSKQRFAFDTGHTRIRANQGHSVDVDLKLKPVMPPQILYHGTGIQNVELIRTDGLQKMNRQHVHLSDNRATAANVATRKGKPIVLTINSGEMQEAGFAFYQSENGVWLTNEVPAGYIVF